MRKKLLIFLSILSIFTLCGQDNDDWKDTVYELQQAFRDVSSQVLPVVVEINVVDIITREVPQFNPWQFFFGSPRDRDSDSPLAEPQTREYRQSGLGSGVIVDQRGSTVYIITNNHVAGEAEEIKITFYDGREFDAVLVGSDPNRDLALLSIETDEKIPLAVLGDSDSSQVGDWVLAVGNPYGFESTVTQGIISAKSRRNDEMSGGGYTDYLQTDASINSGNSGGALVNLDGEVIGINTWIASQSGGSVGLGFAIPINNAKNAIDDLISGGTVEYGWLGVHMGTATDVLKDKMDLAEWDGVFLFSIYTDSPAQDAGLSPGDLIIAMDGKAMLTNNDLVAAVSEKAPGDLVRITYVRNGREYTKRLELGCRDEKSIREQQITSWPGFTAAELTPEMRENLGLSRTDGNLIIGNVDEKSQAALVGLQNGDVIKSINRKTPRDLPSFYECINSDDLLNIKILRRGYEFDYNLDLSR